MVFVVLGMHKSGTSVVTQILHESGIDMGDFDLTLSYDQSNKSERYETQQLNRSFLHGLLIPPIDYLLKKPFRPKIDRAGYRINRDSTAIIRTKALQKRLQTTPPPAAWAQLVAAIEQKDNDWGFKDPRTCLTYPMWQRVLPPHKIIVVYRHYNQLLTRYKISARTIPQMFRVLHNWCTYNLRILQIVHTTQCPVLLLNYERLMQGDGELQRLRHFVGKPLVDSRRPDLYRNRQAPHAALPATAMLIRPFLPLHPQTIFTRLESARAQTCASNSTQSIGQAN